jgi:hypothetical protein
VTGDRSDAISNNSTGLVTIKGGEVTATDDYYAAIRNKSDGSVTVEGGIVSATGYRGSAIFNASGGSVTIKGGEVTAINGTAIFNYSTGSVTIEDGTVSAAIGAISNYSTGSVTVEGGIVSTTGIYCATIYNESTGSVTVEGGIVSTTGDNGYAIHNYSTGSVTIEGGEVSATGDHGYAIRNESTGSVTIEGGAVTATTGFAVAAREATSELTIKGGAVFAYGDKIEDVISHAGGFSVPESDGVIIAWNNAGGTVYTAFTNGNLIVYSNGDASAVWANLNAVGGIQYEKGENKGWFAVYGVTVNKIAGGAGTVRIDDWIYGEKPSEPTTEGDAGVASFEYKAYGSDDATYSENIPEDVGSYTVRATFTFDNHDNTHTDTDNFKITPLSVTITLDWKHKTYGDTDPTLTYTTSPSVLPTSWETDFITLKRAPGEDVGDYPIELDENNSSTNYDVSFSETQVMFNISRKAIKAPTATQNLFFTGLPQTGVEGGTGYSVTGTNSAINAGKYTAFVEPDGNYRWEVDGGVGGPPDIGKRDIEWTIAKAQVDKPTLVQSQFEFDGSAKTVELTPSSERYEISSDETETDIGEYTAWVSLIDADNYRWKDGDSEPLGLEWSIDAPTSIRDGKNTGRGMWFVNNPTKDVAEIRVAEGAITRVVVYDAIGNIVHDGIEPIWNLTNTAGRFVANGTYLVVVETKDKNGRVRLHSAKLGIKR